MAYSDSTESSGQAQYSLRFDTYSTGRTPGRSPIVSEKLYPRVPHDNRSLCYPTTYANLHSTHSTLDRLWHLLRLAFISRLYDRCNIVARILLAPSSPKRLRIYLMDPSTNIESPLAMQWFGQVLVSQNIASLPQDRAKKSRYSYQAQSIAWQQPSED